MSKKIKIAQIGVGHDHASNVFTNICRLSDIFEVVGYARVPEDNLDNEWTKKYFKTLPTCYENYKEYTVEEILSMPDLDAVTIETFDLNLVKYAQMAADKGLHVHMDKAPGESAENYERLLSTIKKTGKAFSIGYMYRFNPFIQQIFNSNRKGLYGKLYSVDSEMSCYYSKDKREWLDLLRGGMMQYLGCHLIDLVVRLLGVPEEIISFNTSTGYEGIKAKDFGLAILKYNNGVSIVKSTMSEKGGYVRRKFAINGEKASFEIRPLEKNMPDYSVRAVSVCFDNEDFFDNGKVEESCAYFRYEEMMRTFAAIIRKEKNFTVDLEIEARVHRCLLTACGIECDYKGEIKL